MQYLIGTEISGKHVCLDETDLAESVLFCGKNASLAACWLALECSRKDRKMVVVDLSGIATNTISGYLRTVDVVSFIPDVLKIPEGRIECASCVSSLLSNVLSLPKNQRLILRSAILQIARENGYVTPSSIFDTVDLVDGFKATEKEEVEGKVATFGQIEIFSGEASLDSIVERSCIVSFSSLNNPHLEDFLACMLTSRVAMILHEVPDSVVFITGAERLLDFFSPARDIFFERYFLSGMHGKVLATSWKNYQQHSWKAFVEISDSELPLGSLLFEIGGRTTSYPIYAIIPERKVTTPERLIVEKVHEGNIVHEILKAVSSSSTATRESIVSWLSAEYPRELVVQELDRLVTERFLVLTRLDERGKLLTLKLTELGKKELEEMEGNGENKD